MYFNLQTQTQHTESAIRAANPNTSFTTPFVPPEGYVLVFPSPQPEHNQVIQTVHEVTPILTAKGHYEQRWKVVPKFTEYTDDEDVLHTVADQEAVAISADNAAKARALQAHVVAATQARLDTFAQTRNYDGILSACTYATSSITNFQAEGQYAVDARDSTWAALYTIIGEVQAGTRPMPAGFADIEADLPVLAWPA